MSERLTRREVLKMGLAATGITSLFALMQKYRLEGREIDGMIVSGTIESHSQLREDLHEVDRRSLYRDQHILRVLNETRVEMGLTPLPIPIDPNKEILEEVRG